MHERLLSKLADRNLESLEIGPREKRTFEGGGQFRPHNNSLGVGTNVGDGNVMGFDDEMEISRI